MKKTVLFVGICIFGLISCKSEIKGNDYKKNIDEFALRYGEYHPNEILFSDGFYDVAVIDYSGKDKLNTSGTLELKNVFREDGVKSVINSMSFLTYTGRNATDMDETASLAKKTEYRYVNNVYSEISCNVEAAYENFDYENVVAAYEDKSVDNLYLSSEFFDDFFLDFNAAVDLYESSVNGDIGYKYGIVSITAPLIENQGKDGKLTSKQAITIITIKDEFLIQHRYIVDKSYDIVSYICDIYEVTIPDNHGYVGPDYGPKIYCKTIAITKSTKSSIPNTEYSGAYEEFELTSNTICL